MKNKKRVLKKALEGHAGQYEVVLSNPPYQIMDGGNKASSKPIYHEIVMYAIKELSPQYVCMITPSRWMAGGKGLDDYRSWMLGNKSLRLIYDYPATYGVFGDVAIAGGVSYFLWDKNYNGLCVFNDVARDIGEFDVLVRDNASVPIIRKVRKHKGAFCNGLVMPRKPFGMATNFSDWVPEGTASAVKIYTVNQQIRWALANSIMDTNGILGKHKVCMSKVRSQGIIDAEGRGEASPVFGKTFQIPKGEACTETYIVVGAFNSKKEADNYEAYLHTRFYRFCLRNRISGQDINREKFAWVPDLGSYANPVTDEDLFAHFNLTKKEIEHIESTIKE